MSPIENGDGHVFSPKRELARTPPKIESDFAAPGRFASYELEIANDCELDHEFEERR